jgi:Telomere recombination
MTGTTSHWCAGTSPARPVRLRRQTGVPGHQGSNPRKLDLHPARDQGSAAQTAAPEEEDRRRAIPRHVVAQALLAELGEPLVSSTLLLPGQDEPLTDGWIAEQLDHAVDAVIDSGDCGTEPTVSARADRARRNQARNYGRPSARPQLAQKQPMCAHIHGHITTSARTESARRNGAGQMAFTVCNGCGVWSGCSPSVMWRERLASGRAGCSPLIEVLRAAEAATMPG